MNFPVLQTCFVPFKVQELALKVWLKEKVRKKKKKTSVTVRIPTALMPSCVIYWLCRSRWTASPAKKPGRAVKEVS